MWFGFPATVLVGSWLTFQQLLEHMWYVVRAPGPVTVEMLTKTVAVSDLLVLEYVRKRHKQGENRVGDVVK